MSASTQPPSARLDRSVPGWTVLLAAAIWLAMLAWMRPLMLPDEGRYAGVAWDMYRNGMLATPLLDGMPYFHKPPLYYWLAQAAYACFGANEFSARMPSLLAAWATLAGVYLFVERYRGASHARMAVLVLATVPFFYGGAQFANMDMLVAGTITLATLAGAAAVLEHGAARPHRRLLLCAAVMAALALLAKGLIGVVLPLGILVVWVGVMRQWRALRMLCWPPAIGLFLLIGLPWFVLMSWRYPGFFHYFFVYQHFERFAASGFNNAHPAWFYLPVLVGLALPWTFWTGGAFRQEFWADAVARPIRVLSVVWIVVVVGFFSVPHSKLIGYVLPALPPLALLLSDILMPIRSLPAHRLGARALRASWIVAVMICVGAVGATALSVKAGRHSSSEAFKGFATLIAPGDTVVALHAYPFDLSFYARLPTAFWVVEDWTRTDIPVRDNWRKELFDAAQFDPDLGRELLVHPRSLVARACASSGTFWVLGDQGKDERRYALLHDRAPFLADGKRSLWRVPIDAAFKADHCDETPKGG